MKRRRQTAVNELRGTGGCVSPIRLRGLRHRVDRETGEVLASIDTAHRDGGAMVVACGDRRAAKCPSCARTYQGDAFQLVAAGLRGGKGVSELVAGHPAVLVTLTAPSFGRVHTIRDRDGYCPCHQRHAPDDPTLGTPLDPTTYRYREQVIWNAAAPVLWKRTAQDIRRRLARELGVPRSLLSEVVRIRFVKVAEFQRRGVVHFHVLIRADGPEGVTAAPPTRVTVHVLEAVVRDAVGAVRVTSPLGDAAPAIRWGRQLDIAAVDPDTAPRAAGYVAKYATKATEAAAGGLLISRIHSGVEADALEVPRHAKRLVKAAWQVGGDPTRCRARRWAHQFGYGGHALTKSRDFSVTFGELRAARHAWRVAGEASEEITVGRLTFAGRGYSGGVADLLAHADAPARGDP